MEASELGRTFVDGGSGKKDAFHAPAVFVTSRHSLSPAARVKFCSPSCESVEECTGDDWEAIVDPFLPEAVNPNEDYFWVLLRPNLVTKVFHHFDIPGKPTAAQRMQEMIDEAVEYDREHDECRHCY